MKRKIYTLLAFAGIFSTGSAIAQKQNVGIGTTSPDQSAVLEIQSVDKGLLIPRLSKDQMYSIKTPATGLMIYQTGEKAGFYFYDGKSWNPLTGNSAESANSVAADPNDWSFVGNSVTNTAFIGTTNSQTLKFKVNNVNAGLISSQNLLFGLNKDFGATGIGTGTGNTGIGTDVLKINSTGQYNAALGFQALQANTTGQYNMAIGPFTLYTNSIGNFNTGVGSNTILSNTTGNDNVAIGTSALRMNVSGSNNTAIGTVALRNNPSGNNNTALGHNAGRESSGSSNLFLGYNAGYSETGSNKLYISNSNTSNPLLKGEFDNKNLKINTGATTSTTVGFLAVGNFDAAFTMPTSNSYRLIVQDGIITEKVKVALRTTADWADYVFDPSYKLISLDKVEEFTKLNKHLPNVPSADEMASNGLDVGQTSKMFMEKIEEITLYLIELNKQVQALKAENETLKASKLK